MCDGGRARTCRATTGWSRRRGSWRTTSIELSAGQRPHLGRQRPTACAHQDVCRHGVAAHALPTCPGGHRADLVYGAGAYATWVINTFIFNMTTTDDIRRAGQSTNPQLPRPEGWPVLPEEPEDVRRSTASTAASSSTRASNPYDSTHPFANAPWASTVSSSSRLRTSPRVAILERRCTSRTTEAAANLTLDYGVRFYFLSRSTTRRTWRRTGLPREWDPAQAVRLFERPPSERLPGYDATRGARCRAFIGRVVPGSGDRFNGRSRRARDLDTLTDGSKFRCPRAPDSRND